MEKENEQNSIQAQISSYSIQIWEKDRGGIKWYPTASGVLCRDDSDFYIVTCAHAFSGNTNTEKVQGLVMSNTFTPLNEELLKAHDTSNEGKCDIAIIKLSQETKDYLTTHYYTFLDSNKMGVNLSIQDGSVLYVCGYPASKTRGPLRGKDGKFIKVEAFSESAHEMKSFPMVIESKVIKLVLPYICNETQYNRLGLDKDSHILLDFHYRKLSKYDDSRTMLPKPNGLSGSGLWAITATGDYYLMGIMIEYDLINSYMLATRIDYATELMRHVYHSQVPKSNIVPTDWYLDNTISDKL